MKCSFRVKKVKPGIISHVLHKKDSKELKEKAVVLN